MMTQKFNIGWTLKFLWQYNLPVPSMLFNTRREAIDSLLRDFPNMTWKQCYRKGWRVRRVRLMWDGDE